MSFSKHGNNKANKIYVMGKDYVQKINDTTICAEKMYYRNFTDPGKKFVLSLHYNGNDPGKKFVLSLHYNGNDPGKKFVLSLHYNGNDSYLFVNGWQELKFKTKTDQLVK